jgi:Flp pilus assembly pilin Flp
LDKRLSPDERGASLTEYALLVALVTLIALGFIVSVGSWVNGMWGVILR